MDARWFTVIEFVAACICHSPRRRIYPLRVLARRAFFIVILFDAFLSDPQKLDFFMEYAKKKCFSSSPFVFKSVFMFYIVHWKLILFVACPFGASIRFRKTTNPVEDIRGNGVDWRFTFFQDHLEWSPSWYTLFFRNKESSREGNRKWEGSGFSIESWIVINEKVSCCLTISILSFIAKTSVTLNIHLPIVV